MPPRKAGRNAVMAREPVPRLAGIVLAAGEGRRFGGAKQVARLGGVTLVERAARLALATCPAGVVVVTGAHAAEVAAALAPLPVAIAHNVRWATGLAGSLRCGVEALPAGAGACLVLLCDQAAVDEADLRALIDAWRKSPERPAAALHGGRAGVPAIFPRSHWVALRGLEGDEGARALLAALPDVTAMEMPHAAADVDAPADLDSLRQ